MKELFFNEFATLHNATLEKKLTPSQVFFKNFDLRFQNTYLSELLPVVASLV